MPLSSVTALLGLHSRLHRKGTRPDENRNIFGSFMRRDEPLHTNTHYPGAELGLYPSLT